MNTEEINTISKLESLKFEGGDACLSTSLFEYGLLWHEGEAETTFIYGIAISPNGYDFNLFDRCTIANDCDVLNEYDWCDFEGVYKYNGTTVEEWAKLPLQVKISDLVSFYRYENIFGSTYCEGFTVKEES